MDPIYADDWLTMYQGDCRDVMASMEAESVQSVICSPPYFGLRDYGLPPAVWPDGWEGTLGLEPTPDLYVEHVVEVFREYLRPLASGQIMTSATGWMRRSQSSAPPRPHS